MLKGQKTKSSQIRSKRRQPLAKLYVFLELILTIKLIFIFYCLPMLFFKLFYCKLASIIQVVNFIIPFQQVKFIVAQMSDQSDHSSFCAQCHKERIMTGKNQLNNLLTPDMYTHKVKDLKDAENKFLKLQKEIVQLKEQNDKKIQQIQNLKKQVQQKQRKSSVQIQIQENKKQFQQLKNSLISFGNHGFTSQQENKIQNRGSSRQKGCISTELIINSLQKRLKQYKIELIKLIQKVELHQKSTEWMYQFIQSFLKMVIEINRTGKYGQPLVLKQLSIKKRTKIAWKYLKDILEKILNS